MTEGERAQLDDEFDYVHSRGRYSYQVEECPECDGSGLEPDDATPCFHCNGEGVI